MRVMVFVKANKDSEAGTLPKEELLIEMGQYNEELVRAGILLGGEGLKPSSQGARVRFDGEERSVVQGPFPDTESLVAGFWIWQVESMAEAIEWAQRCPNPTGIQSEIEIRPIFEAEDFAASDPTGEIRAAEERMRAELAAKS